MFVRSASCAALTLALMTSSALADAITYSGTIGTEPILIEMTEPEDGPFIGRLTRLVDGIDIPLQAVSVSDDGLQLAEELSCLEVACTEPEDGIFDPPLGPSFQLSAAGEDFVGVWSDGNREAKVRLVREGSRPYDRHETFAYQSFVWKSYGEPLSMANSPYDYLRMQVPLNEGPAIDMGVNTALRMVADPRTKFKFPRVSPIQGGPDTRVINDVLQSMHWETSMRGFDCLSMRYLSAGWSATAGADIGTLGHVDEELVTVTYLSEPLISFVQSGSLFCAGSAFYNHIDYVTLDLATGEPFDLSRVFRGWVPTQDGRPADLVEARRAPMQYSWGPDAALTAFVRARIGNDRDGCETAEDVPDFLDISFDEEEVAVFRIAGLDNQALPCEGKIFSAPLAELRELLTDEAARIFPSLIE